MLPAWARVLVNREVNLPGAKQDFLLEDEANFCTPEGVRQSVEAARPAVITSPLARRF